MTVDTKDFLIHLKTLCFLNQSCILNVEEDLNNGHCIILTFSNQNIRLCYYAVNKALCHLHEQISSQLLDEIKQFFGINAFNRQFKYLKRVKI